jgi:hypothetical protein
MTFSGFRFGEILVSGQEIVPESPVVIGAVQHKSVSESVHNSPLTILFETSSAPLTAFPHDKDVMRHLSKEWKEKRLISTKMSRRETMSWML